MNRSLTQGQPPPAQTAPPLADPRARTRASSYGRIHQVTRTLTLALIVLLCAAVAGAQVTTGNVRGVVKDQNGAVVPGAQVTLTNKATNIAQSTQTTTEGAYEFNNLLAGEYALTIAATNFKVLTVADVRVLLNQTTDVPAELQVGLQGETVDVSAGGAELVDTTTTNLSKGFSERQVVELAQSAVPANTSLGVYNLGLVAPNVSSSGGVGVGSGGSVGGQRPRNNNFVVDGVDNNDKVNTGPKIYISPETVSEFSLLSNQYSAEFGHSTGGQFILATKSGTNQFHGTAYGFFNNRYLNAIDVQNKQPGSSFTREKSRVDPANGVSFIPRADFDRYGGNVGGPLIKNRLFFFTLSTGQRRRHAVSCADRRRLSRAERDSGPLPEQSQPL
jgi:Carboxypeptidase regulatory-like domain